MRSEGLHYLIPIDFSDAAYQAAQYVLYLARKAGGKITLLHVLEPQNISSAHNPITISEMLRRSERATLKKLKGLQDIIKTCGIEVHTEMIYGTFPESLIQAILRLHPDVTVIGRKSAANSQLIHEVLQHTAAHLLVVPHAANPEVPHRALVAADLSDTSSGFDMLVRFLVTMEQDLALVHIADFAPPEALQEKVKRIRKKFGIDARLIPNRKPIRPQDILLALKRSPADWLCLVRKKRNFLTRIFEGIRQEELTTQAEVPVLVIRE
ncbi:MAG: universal stress protein [Cyclobacteriaceae bacterium]|nr:universal stress protein [Cyclobacteriaceae bacterium]MDW8331517.1 universal stress protein [Cyclobacteriaceae bacterium]